MAKIKIPNAMAMYIMIDSFYWLQGKTTIKTADNKGFCFYFDQRWFLFDESMFFFDKKKFIVKYVIFKPD